MATGTLSNDNDRNIINDVLSHTMNPIFGPQRAKMLKDALCLAHHGH